MIIISKFNILLRSQKEEIRNKQKITFNSLREYEKHVLYDFNKDQVFEDIPDTNDILGNFLDKVVGRSMYVYKNR